MKKMIQALAAAAAILLSCHGMAAETATGKTDIAPSGTYKYAQRDTCDLFLDIYEPAPGMTLTQEGIEKPTVIFMFGGGFIGGKRDDAHYGKWFDAMAANGYRVVSIDYRLGLAGARKVGIAQVNLLDRAIHMAVEDLFSATAFLIENAETLGIDPDNIVISGSSAGAITVLQAEYELCNMTQYAGILPDGFRYAGVMSFAGGILSRKGKLRYAETPAPTLLLHGMEDRLVNYGQIKFFNLGFFGSDKIAARFSKFGYNYNILRYTDCGHEIANIMDDSMEYQFKFLHDNVIRGEKFIVDMIIDDPAIMPVGSNSRKELYGGNN